MKFFLRAIWLVIGLVLLLARPVLAADQIDLELKDPAADTYTRQTVTQVALTYEQAPISADVPAFLSSGRTMVPVRVISEALHADVQWNQEKKEVTITLGQQTIVLTIDAAEALVGGETIRLYDGIPATLVKLDGVHRTMVPLRFVSEQLGADVAWDPVTYTADILPPAPLEPFPQQPADLAPSAITAPVYRAGALTSAVDGPAQPVIFSLPGRVVIDFPGAVFSDRLSGSVPIPTSAVHTVRYNQYDAGYPGYDRVARIVLDLRPGYGLADLFVGFEDGLLTAVFPMVSKEQMQAPQPPEPAAARIVLDAGHGGAERGALIGELAEKELNLPVALKVGQLLENMGYEVLYTRRDDSTVSLAERADFANAQQADLFVCIHSNSFPDDPAISGLETYYLPSSSNPNSPAKLLAGYIQASAVAASGAQDRSIRPGSYYVLRHTDMPAVLIEMGYMTNDQELERLLDSAYQDRMAAGIAAGIARYLQEGQ